MERLQETLETAQAIALRNLERAQDEQKRYYDRSARTLQFNQGDSVLVRGMLFPTLATGPWAGPFPITRVLGRARTRYSVGPAPLRGR